MFERLFKDEDEWKEVTGEEVRKGLDGYYKNVDLAIEYIQAGQPLDTPFSVFRWIVI
jgi:hypothetical protein